MVEDNTGDNCPRCQSENTQYITECYEDDKREMIEHFLVCNDCNYDERY